MKVHDTVLTTIIMFSPAPPSGDPKEAYHEISEPMSTTSCHNRAKKARVEVASGGNSAVAVLVFCDKVKVRQEIEKK